MTWQVEFHPDFRTEFGEFAEAVQDELLALLELLRTMGPALKRPWSDTLNGSKHANLKELRFDAEGGVWRVAYAFDPSGRRSCWSAATSREDHRSVSTSGSFAKLRSGSTNI